MTLRPLSGLLFASSDGASNVDGNTRPILKVQRRSGYSFSFAVFNEQRTERNLVYYPRPGAARAPLVFTTSDSAIFTVTTQLGSTDIECCFFSGLLTAERVGTAQLAATLGSTTLVTLPVTVEPVRFRLAGQSVPGFRTALFLTPDISSQIPLPVTLTVEDPEAAQLSDSSQNPTSTLSAPDVRTLSNITLITSDRGKPVRIRVQSPAAEEAVFDIPSSPPQFILYSPSGTVIQPDSTGTVSVSLVTPSATLPGATSTFSSATELIFRIRSEDPSVIAVDQPTLILRANQFVPVTLRAVARSGETDIVVEGPPGIEPTVSRLRLRIAKREGDWITLRGATNIGQDLEARLEYVTSLSPTRSVTFTSSDPQRLLLRLANQSAASSAITTPASSSSITSVIILQALAGEGTVDLTISAPDQPTITRPVTLSPATAFWASTNAELFIGNSVTANLAYGPELGTAYGANAGIPAAVQSVRSGATPPRVEVVNSNPRALSATVAANGIVLAPREAGLANLDLRVDGRLAPRSRLRVRVNAGTLSISRPATLGKDLSAPIQVSLNSTTPVPLTITSSDPSRLLINGQPRLETTHTSPIRLESLSDSGFARVTVESPAYTTLSFDVELVPARLSIAPSTLPSEFVLGATSSLSIGLVVNGNAVRPGAAPITFNLVSSNPQVVASPGTLTFTASVMYIPLRALAPGETTLELQPAPGFGPNDSRKLTVRLPQLTFGDYTLPDGFEMRANANVENGSPLAAPTFTVRSLAPEILRLAPASGQNGAAAPGVASLQVAGRSDFYLQAYGVGDASVEISAPGYSSVQARVRLIPAALRLGDVGQLPLASRTTTVEVFPDLGNPQLNFNISFRSDRAPIVLRLESNDPTVAVAEPATITYPTTSRFTVRALKPGTANLRVVLPDGVTGPASTLTVTTPPLMISAPPTLGRDLMAPGSVNGAGGFSITETVKLTSTDPSRLTLSTSPLERGTASVTVAGSRSVYFHALSDRGTVEVVAEADSYQASSLEVRLVPSGVVLDTTGPINLLRGNSSPISARLVGLDPVNQTPVPGSGTIRPGVTIPVFLTSSDPTIGTLAPANAQLTSNGSASFTFTATRAGTATLALAAVASYTTPRTSTQVTINVADPSFTLDVSSIGAWLGTPLTIRLDTPLAPNTTIQTSVEGTGLSLSVPPAPQSGFNIQVMVNAQTGSGEGTLIVAAPGYTTKRFPLRIVPSGFIFNGGTSVFVGRPNTLSFKPVALDPATLSPLSTHLEYRLLATTGPGVPGTEILLVANDNPTALTVTPAQIPLAAGFAMQTLTLQGRTVGQATLRLNAPARFTTPASGHIVNLQVYQ